MWTISYVLFTLFRQFVISMRDHFFSFANKTIGMVTDYSVIKLPVGGHGTDKVNLLIAFYCIIHMSG
jgi:hypothetical protein